MRSLAILLLCGCGGDPMPPVFENPDDPIDMTQPPAPDLATAPPKDASPPPKDASPPDLACAPVTWYRDHDGDGYGDVTQTTSACTAPSGYVADHSDCDDNAAAVHPKAPEVCNLIDDDCDHTVDGPNCASFAQAYPGSYTMHTVEKLGASVLHEVTCSGTSAVTIDLSASPVVKGTVTCSYSGGLTLFSATQNGTIAGSVAPDGSLTGQLTHQFGDSSTKRTFNFTGTVGSGHLSLSGTGSWLPDPQSVQAWDVDFSVN
jgi:hypothetical protein